MTIYTSQMISGAVGQQLGMFAGYNQFSQQMGMMPQLGYGQASGMPGMGGMWGEQMAMRMANAGNTAMGVGMAGVGLMSAFSPIPMDPISGAFKGFGMGGPMGAAIGAGVGGMMGLPLMAATQAVHTYGQAFTGGMQQQAGWNSQIRNNFQFVGGQGAFGRGFSQAQMGQIGSMMGGEMRNNPFTSASELGGLVAGGAQSGMFTAVRDVQQFTQRFRQMLNTLKDVQRELGGTLTDALQFVRGAQQSGIFRQADQVNFAAEVRSTEAVTGMDRQQLIALSAQGAQISRAFGGVGRQGAMGILRGAQTIGAAIQAGSINQEMLSEATGGLTGTEAMSAFAGNMLERAGRFSRTGMGRYSLFALSNGQGTGLDADMMARFTAGDLTTGEVSRTAHRRVGEMGRARALSREGLLRGAVMEQGGLAGQIGMMRLLVGDRVMDQSDDMASLVLQRRFHMQRPEAEMMMSLMRNQGSIAQEEALGAMGSRRQQAMQQDITQNRSMDAFMRHLEHGLSDATGVTRVRELGRSFLSRLSSLTERAMNDLLGTAASSLSAGDERALSRLFIGRGSASDRERLRLSSGGEGTVNAQTLFERPGAQALLHAMPFGIGHGAPLTAGETLARRGVTGLTGAGAGLAAQEAVMSMRQAREGFVSGASAAALRDMEKGRGVTMRSIAQASLMSRGDGSFYETMGGDANATDAFMRLHGMTGAMQGAGGIPTLETLGRGGRITGGMLVHDAGVMALNMMAGPLSYLSGEPLGGRLRIGEVLQSPEERAAGFFSGGNRGYEASLRRRARGMTGEDVERMVERIRSGSGARDVERTEGKIRALYGQSRVQAARLFSDYTRAGEGGGREATEAVLGSEEFQRRARDILGAGEGLSDQLESLRAYGGTLEDEGQRSAVFRIAEQIQHGAGPNGEISDEVRQALMASGYDPRRAAEVRARRMEYAASYNQWGREFGRVQGLTSMGEAMTAAGTAFAGEEDPIMAASRVRRMGSMMDTGSEAYSQMTSILGRTEGGRAQLAAMAQDRHLRRELSGRGRRGARGAADAAFGAATGNSLSEMTFELGGGRTIAGSSRDASARLMSLIRRGGEGAESIQRQLREQLAAQGVSKEEAGILVGTLSSGIQSGRRGGLESGNLEALMEASGNSDALHRIQQQATDRMQQQRDPLGFERNEILRRMDTSLNTIRESLGGRASGNGGTSTGEAQ